MSDSIRVEHLTKVYVRYAARQQFSTLKSAIVRGSLFRDLTPAAKFTALDDISFSVPVGTTLAIIGPNGSGKSTLLKVIAGVLKPSAGRVQVTGRVAALLELGAGFHPEISGRENILVNGMMLGLSRREIERRVPDIIAFSELEEFIDDPVRTYSSGMYMRLAFSVATAVEPSVLLIDEILAVGDESFSRKCLNRFIDLKRQGCTIVIVTHALEVAAALADHAILIEHSRLTASGIPRAVIDQYRGHVEEKDAEALGVEKLALEVAAANATPVSGPDSANAWAPGRWGSREVEITQVALKAKDGTPRLLFHTGETVLLDLELDAHEAQVRPLLDFTIRSRDGRLAYATNNSVEGFRLDRIEGRSRVLIEFPALMLIEGDYALDVAIHSEFRKPFDYRHGAIFFEVRSVKKDQGIARLEHAWRFEGGIQATQFEVGHPALGVAGVSGGPEA